MLREPQQDNLLAYRYTFVSLSLSKGVTTGLFDCIYF